MEEEIALLQFVALALPAVAILMQAVVRFHDQYFTTESEATLRIEFRFLEFTFLGLVMAGGVFAISIFLATESIVTRIGIVLLSLALLMIVPATWFTFRRAKYPTKSFDSPEELVISAGKTVIKLSIIFGATLALLIGLGQLVRIDDNISTIDIQNIENIALFLLILAIILGALNSVAQYYQSKLEASIEEEWKSKLKKEMQFIKIRMDKDGLISNGGRKYDYKTIRNFAEKEQERLLDIEDDLPKDIEEKIRKEMETLKFSLSDVSDHVRDINEAEKEINFNKSEMKSKSDTDDKEYNKSNIRKFKSRRDSLIKKLEEKMSIVRNTADTVEEKLDPS